jgi:hypothetical protein
MARPQKNNVDYFPFICEDGNKMFYIEETYGNDGFATFVKILRELAKTDYHYLDLSKPTTLMFLSAKCKISKELLLAIIKDLVDLGKFDAVLWNENSIVWCQYFIDHIQDAYLKRNNKCITYDGLLQLLIGLGIRKPIKLQLKGVGNTQSKVKETKAEEIKLKETKVNKILLEKEPKKNNLFPFRKSLIDYGFKENLVDDWLKVRKTKNATNTETAFNSFIEEIEKRTCDINEMLGHAVVNSWSGFKHLWVDNLNKQLQKNGEPKSHSEIIAGIANSQPARDFVASRRTT